MHRAEITPRIWDRLLAIRDGRACACCGSWSAAERAALDLYSPIAARLPEGQIVAQIGQSLDGRIAAENDDARDISGPDGLAHLHRIRALVDGVVIGVRTALHDRPRLTVRLATGPNPARVIIDPAGRLPDDAPVLAANGARRLIVQSVDRPRAPGIEVLRLARAGEWIDPAIIIDALRARGIRTMLVEGGSITIARFFEAGLLTRLHVAVAPLIIGAGPQGLTTRYAEKLSQAIRPDMQAFGLGSDVVFDCALVAARLPSCADTQPVGAIGR
jgi:riboflavin-specific deaminase-like protein